jgi:hypothetical protein
MVAIPDTRTLCSAVADPMDNASLVSRGHRRPQTILYPAILQSLKVFVCSGGEGF